MKITELDEGLICREYRQAANKNKQVGILADLNDCKKEVILEILSRNGEISGLPAKKKTDEVSEFSGAKPAFSSKGFKWTPEADAEVSRLSKEGLKLNQIAERMGISAQAIYSRRKYLSTLFEKSSAKTSEQQNRSLNNSDFEKKQIERKAKSNDKSNEKKVGLDVMTVSEKVIALLKDAGWNVINWSVNVIDGTFHIAGERMKNDAGK